MSIETPPATTSSASAGIISVKGNKSPPLLQKAKSYDDWVKKLKIWVRITCLSPESQGGAVLMSLDGEAEDAVLELSEEELTSPDSITHILNKLDSIFKKNSTLEKFEALDNFESYCRPHHVSINDFIVEFDKRLNKTKKLGTNISDDLLAYRLIKSANLSAQDEKMVKATCDLVYDDVKGKLKSIYGDAGIAHNNNIDGVTVKSEGVYETHSLGYNINSQGRFFRGRGSRGRYRGQSNVSRFGKNPLNKDGTVTKCWICKSESHWAMQCPNRNYSPKVDDNSQKHVHFKVDDNPHMYKQSGTHQESSLVVEHLQLFTTHNILLESDVDKQELSDLLSDTWNSALLDSGATKTVAGKVWVDNYIQSLSAHASDSAAKADRTTLFRRLDFHSIGQHLLFLSARNMICPPWLPPSCKLL